MSTVCPTCKRSLVPMRVYEVTCSECGDLKWPTLEARPETYICSLCAMLTPKQRETREVRRQRLLEKPLSSAKNRSRTKPDPEEG